MTSTTATQDGVGAADQPGAGGAAPHDAPCAHGLTRRRFVVGAAAVTGAAALAACTGGTGPATRTTAAGGASGAAADGALVALADVPVGGAVVVERADGKDVVVSQPAAGTVVAFDAACTHQGCAVRVDGAALVCPCHASVFDVATGENLEGPAPRPLAAVAVEVRGGQVVQT